MQKSKCPFCNMELNFINPSHLKKHNIKMYEFKKKFPNICVCSDAFKEHLKSISGNSLGKHSSIEARNKIAKSHIGKKDSLETRKRKSESRIGNKNPMYGIHRFGKEAPMFGKKQSENSREKNRNAQLILYSNEYYKSKRVKASLKGNKRGITKPEMILDIILQKFFPNEWKYVGNGEFILAGKCPDFVNINGKKKIIEMFGDYWHKNDNGENRKNLFKQFGFDTLIIWQSDLYQNPGKVYERVFKFSKI